MLSFLEGIAVNMINDIITKKEYGFLDTYEHLKGKLIFLTFGGSHAYGTATPDSDVDVRGCAFNSKADLIGMSEFEQVVETNTDTTIYSFNKLISLLVNTNPNTIEMLGCKPEHYVLYSPVAQEMIDNRKMFLSQRAANSFGNYANQQLRRLQNAVARDSLTQPDKEKHILNSVKSAMLSFNERYERFPEGAIEVYLDRSDNKDFDVEMYVDVNLKKYPLRDYRSLWSEMTEVIKAYGKLNHRNSKKDELHLNKHAMHLVRLLLMAIDIFEREEVITYRENDLELLQSIRSGKYMNEDGTYEKEFFELVNGLEEKFNYAVKNTGLPEHPDFQRIEDFMISVNERVIAGEYTNPG